MTTTSTQQSYVDERLGLLGRKVGMMRVFTADGDTIPVTVLDVSNNRVSQVKTAETDGYSALQLVFGEKKASRVSKNGTFTRPTAGAAASDLRKHLRSIQYLPDPLYPVQRTPDGRHPPVPLGLPAATELILTAWRGIGKLVGARGGNRTRTPVAGKRILSPLRLPVSPPGRHLPV